MNIKYLNQIGDKVIVKKGEGGGGATGGGSNYLYYDQKQTILNYRSVWENAVLLKVEAMGFKLIGPPFYMYKMLEGVGVDFESSIVAVCLDLNLRVNILELSGTMEEFIGDEAISYLRDEVSITKEEFYAL